jgi:putative endopeptidase
MDTVNFASLRAIPALNPALFRSIISQIDLWREVDRIRATTHLRMSPNMKKFLFLLSISTALSACASVSAPVETTQATTAVPVMQAALPKPELGSYGFDATGMDSSVAPGDDFYAYANGVWAKNTAIPADRSNYGMFTVLDDLSKKRTREILDAAKDDPSSKVGRAYASYLDEAAVNAKGLAPIRPWLDTIRSLKSKSGLAALYAKADRMGVGTPFASYVGQDDKNPDTYIYTMFQGGLGMPERDYYLVENERFSKIRGAYVRHLENVLTLSGETNAKARAQALFNLEKQIATVHWNKIDSSDATKTYNKTTIAALSKAAPGFDFATFIKGVGVNTQDLLHAQPSAFKGIAKLVGSAPLGVLKDALLVRSVDSFANVLSEDAAKEAFSFYSTTLSGTPQMEPRWKRAVSFTEGSMGEELGKAYVAKFFPPETKSAADTLVKNVVAAMGRRIEGLSWMQADTKAKAKMKLANFTTKIGYPDRWRDYSALEVRADDLFGNAVRVREFEHEYSVGKLGQPIYRWEWGMTPMTINAYANFGMNEIVFPAAILQPPFFDPNADPAINYGGIGAVIGHEVSHHFDDEGAKYDQNGRLSDWWTPADVTAFKAATKKLIEQYDVYEPLPGQKINGEFTLGENIGDLAGLTIAYDAYKASLGGKEAPVIDGMTGDQRFFLGWAQVWRRNYREANLSQRLTTDPHSPSIQRVWVMRNIDAWYSAFAAKPGQKLHLTPEQRVRIW